MNRTWAILLAGGIGNRFGKELPKQFLPLAGKQVIDYSLEVFSSIEGLAGITLVLPKDFLPEWREKMAGSPIHFAVGGETRQQSVVNGLKEIGDEAGWIILHDVARPMVNAEMIERCLQGARETGAAVTSLPVDDTLKKGDKDSLVLETVPRDQLYRIQTPQVFSIEILKEALEWAEGEGVDATDEATLVERMGKPVRLVFGSEYNFKITRPADLKLAEAIMMKGEKGERMAQRLRIGEGYDVHPFEEGRKLTLGGVEIPFGSGLKGHSDADALLHAIGDALLGAVAEGDLGAHFPDSDPKYKDISSLILLGEIEKIIARKGFQLLNVDATVVCEKPKLAPFIPSMRENIARALKVTKEQVSVKATTEEGLGFTGQREGLAAKAVVLLQG